MRYPGPRVDGPAEAFTQAAPAGADLAGLCPGCRERVDDAYLNEYVQRLHDAVVEHCEYHLNP
ncbi:hypothetical protein GCM10010124_31670 [Pilimelia terevasa]|uniref:Uncharacterized protein n=1 Tax=Pilimelia terevasa TaxID=53372 RepID=A0A8J3FLP4_9ACTN|nr:hypothetical protein GCM10010124_31670 [Pilimelia terevasa]